MWQKRQGELGEEDEDFQDEQIADFAVQNNFLLDTLNNFQNSINYYTDLLPYAQKYAAETTFLLDLIPQNLSPNKSTDLFY